MSLRRRSAADHQGGSGGKVCSTPAGQSCVIITSAGPASMTAAAWARVISSSGHQSVPGVRSARSRLTAPPRASQSRSPQRHRWPRGRCQIRSVTCSRPCAPGRSAPSWLKSSWLPSTNHNSAAASASADPIRARYSCPPGPGQMPKSPRCTMTRGPVSGSSRAIFSMARVAHAVFPCQSPATPMRSGAFVTVTQIAGVAHRSVIPVSVAELHRSRPLFAAEGMRLVITDLKGDVLPVAEDIARRYPSSGAIGVVTEVSDPAACDALISAAVGRHCGVDVLTDATAIPQQKGPTAELIPEEWDRVMAVNAKGAFLLCRSVIPVLPKPGGAIVFTGSFTGEIGVAERAAYSASKGALRLFTQSLALELARDGIRVNGVAPAFVESAMGRQTLE